MCGILGILGANGELSADKVQTALNCLEHRGPDDEGYMFFDRRSATVWSAAGSETNPSLQLSPLGSFVGRPFDVALAHRRLSILDVTSAGHQPMASPEGRYWLTFNGEIYNFVEIRRELQAAGFQFKTGTDTEVILQAYAQWGIGMLGRFIGMFALAILDVREGKVVVARDPFGIKPLYWRRTGDALAFASEITPLLGLGAHTPKADVESLYHYMRFGVTDGLGDRTMFADVRQLPAAHYMILGVDGSILTTPSPYWVPGDVAPRSLTLADAAAELRHLLDESVRLHLRSDVPLGSCLSGGLDSTAIVMSMRAQLGEDASIHAFSYESGDTLFDEGPYVALATQAFGLERHATSPSADDLVADLPALIRAQEQPFDSTSIYAQYCVFRLAHQNGIKVMLDGQGSDELFGGYQTAVSAQLAAAARSGDVTTLAGIVGSRGFRSPRARRRVILSAAARLMPSSIVAPLMHVIGEPLYPRWLNEDWFRLRGFQAAPRAQGRGRHALREELLQFVRSLSLPRLLRYEDRNSMAFSIESRVPFCTTSLADFAFSLPPSHLVTAEGETKAVLRRAVAGRVPEDIIRRPKIGFETPEAAWLSAIAPWVRRTTDSEAFRAMPFLRHRAVADALAQLCSPRPVLQPAVWRMVNAAAWVEKFRVSF